MPLDRRAFLTASCGILSAGAAFAQSYGQFFKVENDEGRPVANMRLPGELAGQIETLRGVTFIGAREADVTLYEFFDYNCPWCRKAAEDLMALAQSDTGLRIGLVNNPILSVQSAQAAKVVLAVQKKLGSAAAFKVFGTLYAKPGRIDGLRALEAAAVSGLSRAEVEAIANGEEVRVALRGQMEAATNLGLNATPSYVLGNVGVLGHPGPKALARMIAAMRRCDQIACG